MKKKPIKGKLTLNKTNGFRHVLRIVFRTDITIEMSNIDVQDDIKAYTCVFFKENLYQQSPKLFFQVNSNTVIGFINIYEHQLLWIL